MDSTSRGLWIENIWGVGRVIVLLMCIVVRPTVVAMVGSILAMYVQTFFSCYYSLNDIV